MPDSLNSVIIIGLIMAPGYLTLRVARQATRLTAPWPEVEFVVATIAIGILIQASLFPYPGRHVVADWADRTISSPLDLVLWLVLSLLIVPIVVGVGVAKVIESDRSVLRHLGLDRVTRTPRAFQYALERSEGCFVKVYLTVPEGKVVVGRLSDHSPGSTDPTYSDIYIEEVWWGDEDNYPTEVKAGSLGMWFSPSSISRIEFIAGSNENDSDKDIKGAEADRCAGET